MYHPGLLISTLTLALTMCAIHSQAADTRGPEQRLHPAQHQDSPRWRITRIFRHLDGDGNGIITMNEFLANSLDKAARQFARIDTDDDGLISWEEFAAIGHHQPDARDIDVEALKECIAEHRDIDLPDRPDAESRFAEVDGNGDGFIDPDEFETAKTTALTNKFNRIDADADGAITPQELAKALHGMHERREIRRNCIEEQRDMDELFNE